MLPAQRFRDTAHHDAAASVAERVRPLVDAALGDHLPIRLRYWDGSEVGPKDAVLCLNVVHRRALRRLLWAPNELGFARAYVSRDIEVEGDLWVGLGALEDFAFSENGPGVTVDAATKKALVKATVRLGVVGLPPRPPAEEARLAGGGTASCAMPLRLRITTTWATTSTASSSVTP